MAASEQANQQQGTSPVDIINQTRRLLQLRRFLVDVYQSWPEELVNQQLTRNATELSKIQDSFTAGLGLLGDDIGTSINILVLIKEDISYLSTQKHESSSPIQTVYGCLNEAMSKVANQKSQAESQKGTSHSLEEAEKKVAAKIAKSTDISLQTVAKNLLSMLPSEGTDIGEGNQIGYLEEARKGFKQAMNPQQEHPVKPFLDGLYHMFVSYLLAIISCQGNTEELYKRRIGVFLKAGRDEVLKTLKDSSVAPQEQGPASPVKDLDLSKFAPEFSKTLVPGLTLFAMCQPDLSTSNQKDSLPRVVLACYRKWLDLISFILRIDDGKTLYDMDCLSTVLGNFLRELTELHKARTLGLQFEARSKEAAAVSENTSVALTSDDRAESELLAGSLSKSVSPQHDGNRAVVSSVAVAPREEDMNSGPVQPDVMSPITPQSPSYGYRYILGAMLVIGLAGYPTYLLIEEKPWQSITALKNSVVECVILLLAVMLLAYLAYDWCSDIPSAAPGKGQAGAS